nr:unnamed protein product [Callosobruchus chinensis]
MIENTPSATFGINVLTVEPFLSSISSSPPLEIRIARLMKVNIMITLLSSILHNQSSMVKSVGILVTISQQLRSINPCVFKTENALCNFQRLFSQDLNIYNKATRSNP